MTKFLNISTDNTLGGNSPSDSTVVSQKATKTYIDNCIDGVTSAIQPQLNNKVSYNAIIQNLNSFNNNGKLFLSTLDNCFYSLNRRFTVTGTGFTSFNAAALFDGVFENYSYNNIDVGGTGVVTVTGTAITGTYRQGYILISFYSGRGPKAASDVTIQIENANGNVATLTPTAYSTNGLVLIAEVPTLPTANAISKITFTFVNNRTSGTLNPVELEYFCARPSNTGLLSYVSKTGNSTIYGSLTADSFVKSGGTSSQFLKADGSVDSTTYAPSASIPIVNDATITITQGGVTKGSFTLNQASGDTIALDAGGGSIDAIDNLTITKNNDDEIQAVATVNANTAVGATNPVYDWVGTLQEYNDQNVAVSHPDWVCFITDDVDGGLSVYTKNEVDGILAALYPVGSLYFGTQTTCPLTTLIPGSTWELVAQDKSIQGSSTNHSANTTINAGLPNITGKILGGGNLGNDGSYFTGAFKRTGKGPSKTGGALENAESNNNVANFDASRSSSIYGASSTVQPPAYVANIWRRTA